MRKVTIESYVEASWDVPPPTRSEPELQQRLRQLEERLQEPMIFLARDDQGPIELRVPPGLYEGLREYAPIWSNSDDQRDFVYGELETLAAAASVNMVEGKRIVSLN